MKCPKIVETIKSAIENIVPTEDVCPTVHAVWDDDSYHIYVMPGGDKNMTNAFMVALALMGAKELSYVDEVWICSSGAGHHAA